MNQGRATTQEYNPLVSIVIPVYNGANYMREAIDSALAQTYKNIEIIVVNDGSTDNTEEIARSYGDKIRLFSQPNGGQSAALNRGIQEMRGEYFSWLSHDDKYHAKKIESQVDVLRQHSKTEIIVHSDFSLIDYAGAFVCEKVKCSTSTDIRWELLTSSPVHGCALLISKAMLYKNDLFEEAWPHTSDVRLFFRLSESVQFKRVNQPLVFGRVHGEQATFTRRELHLRESNEFLIYGYDRYWASHNDEVEFIDKTIQLILNWSKRGYVDASNYAMKGLAGIEVSTSRIFRLRLTRIYFLAKSIARSKLIRLVRQY